MDSLFRKYTAILLVGLIVYNSMGYLFVFSAMRVMHRQQVFSMISSLPDSQLVSITLEKNSRQIPAPGTTKPEIKVKGQMYDVVRQKDNGRSITFYCYRDKKEERLVRSGNLINTQQQNVPPLTKTARLILDTIIKTAIVTEGTTVPRSYSVVLPCKIIFHYFPAPDIRIIGPPPKIIC